MNYSFPAFQAAASLVASRAFKVDDAVGDAMVPLADVFNHKASVVALSDQYAVYEGGEGEDSSDDSDSDADEEEVQEGEDTEDAEGDEEGAASGSEAASESLGSSEASGSGGEGSGSPGASPGAGTMLTSQLMPPSFLADAEPELHGLRSANGLSLALEICIVDDEEGAALRILTASPIGEGREVHNTYGELGNRDLLEKYGFTLPENPHDSVTLELEALWAWGAARHGAREWEARRAFLDANTPWLRRRRYAAVLVHPNGHMPAWCIAAVWLTAAQRDPALPMWEDAKAALGPEVHEALLADPSATMSVLEGALREAAPPDFAEALRALAEPKLQRVLAGSPATDNLDSEVADFEGGRLSDRKTARLTSGQLRASELAILRPLVQTQLQ
uniref:SET domain-containing protein n=2 Tax=Auxenochlorella protothecoides TaxID=3075 RepID=A0A1D2ADH4_AUXPR